MLYKELLKATLETFSACMIVLYNLYKVSGCSVITDFILIMFRFFKRFSFLSKHFWFFYWFCVFFLTNDWWGPLSLRGSGIFSINLFWRNKKNVPFHWVITSFFSKSNSLTIVFKDKFSDFMDWCYFIALAVFRIYIIILGKQNNQKKKRCCRYEK